MARSASPMTVAVRNLLTERKGEITAKEALPILKELGFEIDNGRFDVIKHHFMKKKPKAKSGKAKRANAQAPGKRRKTRQPVQAAQPQRQVAPVVQASDVDKALKVVENAGGLAKLREQIANLQAAAATVDSLAQRVAKAS